MDLAPFRILIQLYKSIKNSFFDFNTLKVSLNDKYFKSFGSELQRNAKQVWLCTDNIYE